jgi:hypothetical protein
MLHYLSVLYFVLECLIPTRPSQVRSFIVSVILEFFLRLGPRRCSSYWQLCYYVLDLVYASNDGCFQANSSR